MRSIAVVNPISGSLQWMETSMDTEQVEIFPAMEYVDLSHNTTARSTRRKRHQHRQRKAIASTKVAIAL